MPHMLLPPCQECWMVLALQLESKALSALFDSTQCRGSMQHSLTHSLTRLFHPPCQFQPHHDPETYMQTSCVQLVSVLFC